MEGIIQMVTMGLVFLIAGLLCLLRAKHIQKWALGYYERNQDQAIWNPFLGYMKSDAYIVVTRIIGFMSIGIFILIVFVLIRHLGR